MTDFAVEGIVGVRDPEDAHVRAAAIACDADILLTNNVRDFLATDAHDLMTPDEFFVLVDDAAPHVVAHAVRKQAQYWGRRDDEPDLPGHLTAANCPDFAERVLAHLRRIALQG